MSQDEKVMSTFPQNIVLEDRKKLTVTGVSDVDSFDERTVSVYTELGEMTVRGMGIHISKLNTETGELTLEGRIDALIYTQEEPKNQGFFNRMFR